MATDQGNNPIPKKTDDELKKESESMPAPSVTGKETATPAAGGDELNVDELQDEADASASEAAQDPNKNGARRG